MIADYGLILDGLIVVLLCATVVYAATLSRRIARLRDNRVELELAARAVSNAAAKAEAGIKGLKQTAGSVGASIQTSVDQARALRDELAFLVEAGEAMAGRLEAAASNAGRATEENQPRAARPQPLKPQAPKPQAPKPQASRAEPKMARSTVGVERTEHTKRDLMKVIENLR